MRSSNFLALKSKQQDTEHLQCQKKIQVLVLIYTVNIHSVSLWVKESLNIFMWNPVLLKSVFTQAVRHRVLKWARFLFCVFPYVFFKASRFSRFRSTALITSLSCRRKMADACLVQSVVLSQVSQVKMCTKISCLIKIFSFLFFPLDSSWAFGRTLLASIACDSRG